jgi:ferredoxin
MDRRIGVEVDHELCVGNGMCRAIAEAVFVEDANGQSVVADANAEPLDAVLQAAALCPVSAISVADADTGEQLDF